MIPALLDYILNGADELTLPRAWLQNRERLAEYEAFTARQRDGQVVQDAASMARARFWQRIEERKTRANVTPFRTGRRA